MKSLKKNILRRGSAGTGEVHELQASSATLVSGEDEFHDAEETMMHVDAHEEGGLGFTNKELLASQRGAIVDVAKELGRKMLTGSFNLINLSMPVKMFEPRSYLQKLTDVWVYPRLLDQAVAARGDPVVRLQWVATWFVAGLQHVFQSWKKPFNPLLGETWQATQDGGRCSIFMEQISHHPPISVFELIGPDGAYVFSGHSQPDVQYKANAIKTTAKGYRCIEFKDDGTSISIVYPHYYMRGILYTGMPRGDMSGTVLFKDHRHGLFCEMQFGKVEGAEDPLLQRSDTLMGAILRIPPGHKEGDTLPSVLGAAKLKSSSIGGLFGGRSSDTGTKPATEAVSTCQGNWLSHLDWDNERRWTLVEEHPKTWQPVKHPLPSDSRFRLDLATLLDGDQAAAQAAKEALENRQRLDAKYRKEAAGVTS